MKKFTAILLAVVMLFALSASAFAATNSLETDYAIGDGLGVSVDLNIEGMYFDGVDILNTATNGYYPFSFSLIVSNRSKVASVTVSNGGSFHWAYEEDGNGGYVTDEDGNYVESTTTKYGVVVLPTTSASTVTVTGTGNIGSATFSCAQPCGGTTAAGTALYAYLPAPAQFVNEGVTTGGWGDAYDSTGTTLKGTSATGVSLGFFGGYAVYEFENPIADDPTHPYGADFIVYGNAFWNNSEAGCIQVSQGMVRHRGLDVLHQEHPERIHQVYEPQPERGQGHYYGWCDQHSGRCSLRSDSERHDHARHSHEEHLPQPQLVPAERELLRRLRLPRGDGQGR